MMKAAYNPIGCHFVQLRIAMTAALDLIHAEVMSWPAGERPTRVHSLEPMGTAIRLHYATASTEHAERSVLAYTPAVWHELALVKDRRTELLHHRPLVDALQNRLNLAAQDE